MEPKCLCKPDVGALARDGHDRYGFWRTHHRGGQLLHPVRARSFHLNDLEHRITYEIKKADGVANGFNAIAVDDGVAMTTASREGHSGDKAQ